MKHLFFILIIFQLNNCNTNITSKENINQKMKDSAYYSNNQLAYIKKGNTVKFYTYKGKLKNELNLDTRIEKKYNLTGELMSINTSSNYLFDMKNGYYSYRDVLIIPKGTIVNNGEDVGTIATANEVVKTIPKNNLGYPTALKFNETGQIIQTENEKREFDDLGRILKRKVYAGFKNEPYKSVEYTYENDNLKKSIHTGVNEAYNFTKEYVFDSNGHLSKVKQQNKNGLQMVSFYDFSDNLLQTKKIYTQRKNDIILELIEYTYDDKKRCINQTYYLLNPDENLTMNEIENKINKSVNKEYPYKIIATDFIFKGKNFIGVKATDLRVRPIPKVTNENVYVYNKFNQLTEVQNGEGKTIIMFSYNT